jgi:hypothetical protein
MIGFRYVAGSTAGFSVFMALFHGVIRVRHKVCLTSSAKLPILCSAIGQIGNQKADSREDQSQ